MKRSKKKGIKCWYEREKKKKKKRQVHQQMREKQRKQQRTEKKKKTWPHGIFLILGEELHSDHLLLLLHPIEEEGCECHSGDGLQEARLVAEHGGSRSLPQRLSSMAAHVHRDQEHPWVWGEEMDERSVWGGKMGGGLGRERKWGSGGLMMLKWGTVREEYRKTNLLLQYLSNIRCCFHHKVNDLTRMNQIVNCKRTMLRSKDIHQHMEETMYVAMLYYTLGLHISKYASVVTRLSQKCPSVIVLTHSRWLTSYYMIGKYSWTRWRPETLCIFSPSFGWGSYDILERQ